MKGPRLGRGSGLPLSEQAGKAGGHELAPHNEATISKNFITLVLSHICPAYSIAQSVSVHRLVPCGPTTLLVAVSIQLTRNLDRE